MFKPVHTAFRIVIVTLVFYSTVSHTRDTASKNTIFLWDLHEVILKKDTAAIAKISCKNIFSTKIIRKLQRPLVRDFFTLINNQARGIETSAEEFIWIADQYNHPALAQMIRDLQNSQQLNPGILPIVKHLHSRGYTHHVGSNIGESCFNQLANKERYPHFSELFSYFDLTAPQVVSFNSNNPAMVIKKPHPSFFTQYLTKNGIDLTTTRVIFIDDKLANITAAQQVGLTAIHFKNPKQLRRTLQNMNLW